MNARFEAAYARIPVITPTKQTAWLCWQARDQEVSDLADALQAARDYIEAARDSLIACHTNPATGQLDSLGEEAAAEDGALLQWINAALSKALGREGEQG